MNGELKLAVGKILGEVYRIQLHMKPAICRVSKAEIYGCLSGIEQVIDEQIDDADGLITRQDYDRMNSVLSSAEENRDFKGFYDIEPQLGAMGRTKARALLTYIKSKRCFLGVIAKMDSQNSPGECKTFDLKDEDI